MLVNCNSCQKKFTVPDSAITEAGRLLQCGSCGNKWTQYPIKQESTKVERTNKEITKKITPKIKQSPKVNKTNQLAKKKKREINLYSDEYLKKKHGITISDNSNNIGIKKNKKNVSNSSFFIYLINTSILIIFMLGVLNLTKDVMISNYPLVEPYINTLYETFEILSSSILNLIN